MLELDPDDDGRILGNKFDDASLAVRSLGRRPFELATLRLQSLSGIQIKNWERLKQVDDRCLTQLGGCAVVRADGTCVYSWLDKGLCDVPDTTIYWTRFWIRNEEEQLRRVPKNLYRQLPNQHHHSRP